MSSLPFPPPQIISRLRTGVVIPAHPLALSRERKLDERRQRALTRYYCAAGAGGIAIGVHTTQFEIREPRYGLYEPVLKLAADTLDYVAATTDTPIIRVAGIAGPARQAVDEAKLAADMGYHLGLVSLAALQGASNKELLDHLRALSEVIALMGFYLQPAVGGIVLNYDFWREAVGIENLLAIKLAPFNRYATLDVIKAVAAAGRYGEIALYTGNDDNIVIDLLSKSRVGAAPNMPVVRMVGGLLGHWAFWTRQAVALLEEIHKLVISEEPIPQDFLLLAQQITDANGAVFDYRNNFAGCIPGIHEILRRQGLLEGVWTLDPGAQLSPGQKADIDRVCAAYPHLNDDLFVKEHLDEWLR